MTSKIIIPLPLMTLNQYTNANRTHYQKGAKAKKQATLFCKMCVLKAMREGFELKSEPADFKFVWYCKNKQTDKDNIAFQRKFIFDGMVNAGLISNDGWSEIGNWTDEFRIDKKFPRVELEEV